MPKGLWDRLHLILPMLACFGGGSLYGWSGLLTAVQDQFSADNAAASMVFSFGLASFTIGVLIGPLVIERLPVRARLAVLPALAAASLLVSAQAQHFWMFLFAYGIGFGFASGALYNLGIASASASAAPVILVPMTVAAFGLGGAVFGPVHVWLIGLGWGIWAVLPAAVCLVAVSCLSAMTPVPGRQSQATKDGQFIWPNQTIAILWGVFASGSCAGLIVLGLAPEFLPTGATGAIAASAAVFGAAVGNTAGRLAATGVAGRFGPKRGLVGALVLSGLVLTSLMVPAPSVVVVAMLFLLAFSYGLVAAQTPLLVATVVSAQTFPSAFGWVFTGWGIAGLVGPWSAGWLLDFTGGMQAALLCCIVLAFISLWLLARLSVPKASA